MRYTRHIRLANFGDAGQSAVESARVLVIGAGGLGSPALMYMAAAGVGTLGIVDDDVVDITNLQRQVLHSTPGQGRPKVETATEALTALNPNVTIEAHQYRITSENAADLVNAYDIVLDCSDNFATRYLVNSACEAAGVPHIWGALIAYYGQVSVFLHDGESPTLEDLYPQSDEYNQLPSPQVKGTFGPVCGMVGSLMAVEAIKILTGVGKIMSGRVALFDAFGGQMRTIPITKRHNSGA
ncbi:Probable adenylyltransferase/sulfurtransferase MoeZ [Arcanobacterium haemolyticum]|uniref:HesA/MoeB/ThiF family protein n=1 Tax=Arcanobacterium haemolyticum TaxID=28264 RepID=UPI000D9C593C|nr:HesA/MoeB/ThiF family protein [Arcanobacterium haemolyticum]SPT75611.1 Probable adenylyltransferase/sulfurtransferase MoeZ [Arcanobacterium haemolyticum]